MDTVKRCSWSAAEVATLVSSVKENNIMKLLDGKRFRNAEIYEIVRLDLEKISSSKTVAQVRAKWKALKSGYSEKNRLNNKSGSNRISCDSEKELDEVLGTRPSIKPLDFGVDSTQENDAELNLLEENIEVIEEDEDSNYKLVYQEEQGNTNDSLPNNKNTKKVTLSQTRTSRRQQRNPIDLSYILDSFNRTMEAHTDFIKEENEKQRKWEEELLKAEKEEAKKDKEEFANLMKTLLRSED